MRTCIALLFLCGSLACSNDEERGRFELSQDPSTADDAGDPRQGMPSAPDGGGTGGAIGGSAIRSPRQGIDAGAQVDAGAPSDDSARDASAADSGVPGSFTCKTANDCAIRNVGSCCGYFPRCANANATFTAPQCSGVAGSCGYPNLDSCGCELGQCISLQAGVRIHYP